MNSLTAALDQLWVVAISIDPHLLPPVEAKFSVDDLVGASSQRPAVCRTAGEGVNA